MSTPPTTRIGCLCVTENRAPVLPIALTSFAAQTHENKELLIVEGGSGPAVLRVVDKCVPRLAGQIDLLIRHSTVQQRLELGTATLFSRGCDVVTMWDDDDYSPPDRLERTAIVIAAGAEVVSYEEGYFCSLRTFEGHKLNVSPFLWGGTLTFTNSAWHYGGGFLNKSCPGYDRELAAAATGIHEGVQLSPSGNGCQLGVLRGGELPIAFVHGKNIATHLIEPCTPLDLSGLPSAVKDALRDASAFLVAHRVFPHQPETL